MKAIIVDDEYRGREVLAHLLQTHCPEVDVVGMASDIHSAYQVIAEKKPELVFLDVEMPGGNGFDLLGRFERPAFRTVFVTSYDQYALQAIKAHAFDYLLKPVMVDELRSTIAQLLQNTTGESTPTRKHLLQEMHTADRLEINHKSRLEYVLYKDILLLEGDGNYTFVRTMGEKFFHMARTLKDFETLLCQENSRFFRVHKKFIVNLDYVEGMERGSQRTLMLRNGTRIDVARRKREEVIARLRR